MQTKLKEHKSMPEVKPTSSAVAWPFPKQPHRLWKVSSTVTITAVGLMSKILIQWLNSVKVYNKDILLEALDKRSKKTPLITVSNHHSCIDDPIIWGTLGISHLSCPEVMRWSLAAHDICFTNKLYSLMFALGKCVPTVRGGGVYQRGMDFCVSELNKGSWVHIFPEAKVNMTKEYIRYKWGVGRLISECQDSPIVIPLFHCGMDDVLPNVQPYIPHIGKKVTINIGNPMDFTEMLHNLKQANASDIKQRKVITDIIQERIISMEKETLSLHMAW